MSRLNDKERKSMDKLWYTGISYEQGIRVAGWLQYILQAIGEIFTASTQAGILFV